MEKYSEQIVDYLYNDMTEPQRKDFEKLMESNAELSAEVQQQRDILKGVHARLVYQEAMEDPHIAEANWLAKRAIGRRETKLLAQTINLSKRLIVVRLISVAAVIIIIFWANLSTAGLTPLRSVLSRSTRYFVSLWKIL